jgi:hypothetical protein
VRTVFPLDVSTLSHALHALLACLLQHLCGSIKVWTPVDSRLATLDFRLVQQPLGRDRFVLVYLELHRGWETKKLSFDLLRCCCVVGKVGVG